MRWSVTRACSTPCGPAASTPRVADLARRRLENAQVRDEIRRLTNDPAAIESLAREELGLMRDGEVLFIVRDTKPGTTR
jgi:cell division protein FtsB